MKLAAPLAIAALIAALDQFTKALIVRGMPFGTSHDVIPGIFSLVHTRNRGIAFGMLGASGALVQTALLVIVAGVIVFVGIQIKRAGGGGLATAGLALVLGGAIGNLIDRIARGEVVDFLDFYLRWGGAEHHWYVFNVADAAISTGAGCIILAELLLSKRHADAASSD